MTKVVISETNPVLFIQRPEPMPVTAHDIGCQIACDSADKQAAVLWHWYAEVNQYGPTESWAMQCRNIAEKMTDKQCLEVRIMLETLIEHLASIPQERRQKANFA